MVICDFIVERCSRTALRHGNRSVGQTAVPSLLGLLRLANIVSSTCCSATATYGDRPAPLPDRRVLVASDVARWRCSALRSRLSGDQHIRHIVCATGHVAASRIDSQMTAAGQRPEPNTVVVVTRRPCRQRPCGRAGHETSTSANAARYRCVLLRDGIGEILARVVPAMALRPSPVSADTFQSGGRATPRLRFKPESRPRPWST